MNFEIFKQLSSPKVCEVGDAAFYCICYINSLENNIFATLRNTQLFQQLKRELHLNGNFGRVSNFYSNLHITLEKKYQIPKNVLSNHDTTFNQQIINELRSFIISNVENFIQILPVEKKKFSSSSACIAGHREIFNHYNSILKNVLKLLNKVIFFFRNDDNFEIISLKKKSKHYLSNRDCRGSQLGLKIKISNSSSNNLLGIKEKKEWYRNFSREFQKYLDHTLQQKCWPRPEDAEKIRKLCCDGFVCGLTTTEEEEEESYLTRLDMDFYDALEGENEVIIWWKLGIDNNFLFKSIQDLNSEKENLEIVEYLN
ncbi:hypothetical protein HK099_007010 [Clydaea vesicula]|uniref:Uncharacterized protein n=1 Tax=Clydaea vesicula TaxID=447962 RepID=A0AAD5XXU7_9FUNG|nr:hypothetical protein HK099_007010 [Clydaea vesicula]